ncbi:MAG: methylated-DNA--[protein]-cysteine S-methyltransferase [Planctomycetota bacterium]
MSRTQETADQGGLVSRTIDTPVGRLRVLAGKGGLRRVRFRAPGPGPRAPSAGAAPAAARQHLRAACEQLREYFRGERTRFAVPLDLSDGTPFQRAVWRACARIPFGEVRSYSELAEMAGYARAARAVGNAMNANPVPIIVPCHRVIRANGSPGGFGSGLPLKRKLLRLESR